MTAGCQAGHGGSADGHHGPHRQIDAAGGDHQRHAEGEQGHRGAAVEYVDEAAKQPTILDMDGEEVVGNQGVDEQHAEQGCALGRARGQGSAGARRPARKGEGG
ncbi:hypothetical protein [Aeromonas rivipollensis]|uniref:hypothetical protein n=1 Tax=Aeromonas rivipollensis TaxID=948519 RepID=UPI001F0C0623|nr:hypothetical protein [Aeromonas rivipollensis]